MKRLCYLLLATCALLLVPREQASASLGEYITSVSSGSALTPSFTDIWTGYYGSRWSYYGATSTLDLPFTFQFNGSPYTQITVNSCGAIGFGTSVPSSTSNNLTGQTPIIAPFWDGLFIGGGAPNPGCYYNPAIRYGISGSAPNRIFVIDYNKISREYCDDCGFGPMFVDFQVRLYEGSNKIEFQYSNMSASWPSCATNYWGNGSTQTSGSIGLAASSSDYISVTPNGTSASFSRSSVNNNVDLNSTTISSNVVYTFTPCIINWAGNIAQGGTATMANGSVLLSNITIERGQSVTLTPFTMSLGAGGCPTRSLTFTLTGPNASDYTVSPLGTVALAAGSTIPVTVTFNPATFGQRTATLTVNDPLAGPRTFTLRATATTRISWTPDLSQGGTANLLSGDTLLKDIVVLRGVPRDFTPMTIQNFSVNSSSPPAVVTYSIDSAGYPSTQYSLQTPASVSLGAGQSSTPIIRFLGTGLGAQNATLTVNADGEIRVFPLKAISGAPGITITNGATPVDEDDPLFHQTFDCVGEQVTTVPLTVTNPGQFPLTITAINGYRTDSTDQQGTPLFPLLRDAQGRLLPLTDYSLTDAPGSAPVSLNTPVAVPIVLAPGQTRTIYANFSGQYPGKRFGRIYIRSNAQNVFGTDTNINATPNSVMGLLTFDLVARAIGSQLSASASGLRLKPVLMPDTRVGDSSEVTFTIANSGACDLRIARNKFRISSGDVNEIKLVSALRSATIDNATGDYLLAPGVVDTVRVRFTPSRSGTRMARLWVQTNDSTIQTPGVAERGAMYLDIQGRGLAGLDARDLVLDPVAIGRSVDGLAVLENTLTFPVEIGTILYMGDDAAEFSEIPAKPWPARPFSVLPGAKLTLGVRLTPTGAEGLRRTTLVLVLTTGDTVRVPIRGEAGTQSIVVSPSSLFDNVAIAVGQSARQTVMISNTGTLPLRLASVRLIGADSLSYRLGQMPRFDLEGGQTEYVEITYAPTTIGQTSAQLEVVDANGQRYVVDLGGTALKFRRDPVDQGRTHAPGNGDIRLTPDGPTSRTRPTLR
jgi:hypothetical protein